MKKILGLVAVSVALFSCNSTTKTNDKADVQDNNDKKEVVADTHNSRNSLDYVGTYKGELPCADCEKIETELKLEDNSKYVRTSIYHKNSKTDKFVEEGTYSWNADGNMITLDNVKDSPNKYIVGENFVRQLDLNGVEITGDLAGKYILEKQ